MKIPLILSIFLISCNAYSQLLVAPTRLLVDGDKTSTTEFIVENPSDTPIRLEIRPYYEETGTSGSERINPNITIEDYSQNIRVSPPVIRNLKPNQRRTIRVQVLADNTLPDGEYRSYLKFTPTQKQEKIATQTVNSEGSNFDLNFQIQTYVPIYIQKGTPVQKVSFDCLNNSISITNHSKYQFNAMIESSTKNKQKLILLRESILTKQKEQNEIVTLTQENKTIYKCDM
ncbi:molecular chaperone [Vibrio kasasachensis]|uniref:fimbrial biogenesis chaperone n=1 Tax=Vibrio kasasachensis TaxID=2910248 RepID=UPI003D0B6033